MTDQWWRKAACLGLADDRFFPDKGRHDLVASALAVCAVCPVRTECLDEALRIEAREEKKHVRGIFGGTLPLQRVAMVSGQRRVPQPSAY